MTTPPIDVIGRLVLEDRVATGRVVVEDGLIVAVDSEDGAADASSPYIAPGFVDVHTHGGGGHDVMDGVAGMDGTARHLIGHGVTSFLPTGVTAPLPDLVAFAEAFRIWRAEVGPDVAEPLGFNLEGPFLSAWRKGAHDPTFLRDPADVALDDLEPLVDGLRVMTVAPELPGALELIGWLHERGVVTSMGHSAATLDQALAGYAAGGSSTTHLFNAMTGVDHRTPGLAVVALGDDTAYVELIADGIHVHPALWPLITRAKPKDRLMLISDAISLAGTDVTHATIGGLEVEVVGQRVTLVGTTTLAGSVIAMDLAVRNLVASGVTLPDAVAAASRNPLAMLGVTDRGRLAVGQRADLVELDDDLAVRRVMRAGTWVV